MTGSLMIWGFDVSDVIVREEKGGGVALRIREMIMVALGENLLDGSSTKVEWVELREKKGASRPATQVLWLKVQVRGCVLFTK